MKTTNCEKYFTALQFFIIYFATTSLKTRKAIPFQNSLSYQLYFSEQLHASLLLFLDIVYLNNCF